MPLDDLRAFYRTGEEIEPRTAACRSSGWWPAVPTGGPWKQRLTTGRPGSAGLVPGTYTVEALAPDGRSLAEELTTVGAHAGERPVHGFATSFDDESVPAVLEWLRALRCTVVQIYDWMASYTEPLRWPSGRRMGGTTLPAGPCPSRLCVLWPPASGRREQSLTPMPPCTPWTCHSPPTIPRC